MPLNNKLYHRTAIKRFLFKRKSIMKVHSATSGFHEYCIRRTVRWSILDCFKI